MIDKQPIKVGLRPWSQGDLALLERLLGDPAMMAHLGEPESAEKIRDRHVGYCHSTRTGVDPQFVIVVGPGLEAAGWIGYWEREWQDQPVFEMGWSVLPEFQGKGFATRAARLAVERAQADGKHQFLHAYPAVDNGPSNAICRKVGFTLQGVFDFEYPKGNWMRCNDWCLDLQAISVT